MTWPPVHIYSSLSTLPNLVSFRVVAFIKTSGNALRYAETVLREDADFRRHGTYHTVGTTPVLTLLTV